MKILLVVPRFSPSVGGVENYTLQMALMLKQRHNATIVIVTSNTIEKKEVVETVNGLRVYRLPSLAVISNSPFNPLWYFTLKRIIREENPDIVNAQAPVPGLADIAAFAAKAEKTPFILSYHSGTMKKVIFIPDIIILIYEKCILPRTAKYAKKIITSSNFVRVTILKKFQDKITVIHPGVDATLFKPDDACPRVPGRALFICRYKIMWYAIKGLGYLKEAIQLLPEATLRIVGEEEENDDKKISYAGILQGSGLVRQMQEASVCILPSLADKESFGMVLAEAMACKTPVIGTRGGGITEVIHDGKDGFLVPEKDSKALAAAMKKIFDDPALASAMGEEGLRKIQAEFSWESRADLTYALYEACL